MSDYGDALREINTLKSQIRGLEEGHSILNQALHKSQEREIKLRNLLTDARSRLKCQPEETACDHSLKNLSTGACAKCGRTSALPAPECEAGLCSNHVPQETARAHQGYWTETPIGHVCEADRRTIF